MNSLIDFIGEWKSPDNNSTLLLLPVENDASWVGMVKYTVKKENCITRQYKKVRPKEALRRIYAHYKQGWIQTRTINDFRNDLQIKVSNFYSEDTLQNHQLERPQSKRENPFYMWFNENNT